MIVAVQVLGTKYTPPYIYVHIYVFEYSSLAHMHTCIFLGARDVLWRYLSFAHSRCVSGNGAREPLAICLLTSSTTITTISQCPTLLTQWLLKNLLSALPVPALFCCCVNAISVLKRVVCGALPISSVAAAALRFKPLTLN